MKALSVIFFALGLALLLVVVMVNASDITQSLSNAFDNITLTRWLILGGVLFLLAALVLVLMRLSTAENPEG